MAKRRSGKKSGRKRRSVKTGAKKSVKRGKSRRHEKKSRKKSTSNRNVYLGKRVRDVGRPGLDEIREVEGICKAILEDYESGRIDKRTANGRYSLLYNVIIPKDDKLKGKKKRAKQIVKLYWQKLHDL